LARGLADEQVLEIEARLVQRQERVLADGAQLEDFLLLVATLSHFDDDSGDENLRLISVEGDRDFLLLLGAEYTCEIDSRSISVTRGG